MEAEVGQWSARRRRMNERITQEQAASVRIGFTEAHDDSIDIPDWALLIASKTGQLCYESLHRPEASAAIEQRVVEIAALCHSFLESLDRRRAGVGGER